MAEAASFGTVATVVAAVGAGTGAVTVPVLAAFGIDGYSVGAGLLGCVAVQVFLPPEKVELWRIAATALGSMIVASFGAPFVTPAMLALMPNGTVSHTHASAVAAGLLGGCAKPIVLIVKGRFEAWFGSWLASQPGAKAKGPEDA